MNSKIITLRVDGLSKLLILLLATGVWFLALKPLGPSTAVSQDSQLEMVRSSVEEHAAGPKVYEPSQAYLDRIAKDVRTISQDTAYIRRNRN